MDRGHSNSSTQRSTIPATLPLYSTVSETDRNVNVKRLPRFSLENVAFRTRPYLSSFIPPDKPQDATLGSTQKADSPCFLAQAHRRPQHRSKILKRRETFLRSFTKSPPCLG